LDEGHVCLGAELHNQTQEYKDEVEVEVEIKIERASVGAAASPRLSGRFCTCGSLMTQTGSCYTCGNCGANTGCG